MPMATLCSGAGDGNPAWCRVLGAGDGREECSELPAAMAGILLVLRGSSCLCEPGSPGDRP